MLIKPHFKKFLPVELFPSQRKKPSFALLRFSNQLPVRGMDGTFGARRSYGRLIRLSRRELQIDQVPQRRVRRSGCML